MRATIAALTTGWAAMTVESQMLRTLLALSQQMGNVVASVEAMERAEVEQNTDLASLNKRMEAMYAERHADMQARRELPDDLIDFVREQHERAKAKTEFYGDLRTSLTKKGIIGVLGLLGLTLLTWLKELWPAFKVWLIEHMHRI